MEWNEWFEYKNGELYWKKSNTRGPIKAGSIAGSRTNTGYLKVSLKGKSYRVHRITYELHKGTIPNNSYIDHIDRNKMNNNIENLRLANFQENVFNREANNNSRLGIKGVSWVPKRNKYHTQIMINGKQNFIGYFDSIKAASEAYEKAAKRLHGEFYYGLIRQTGIKET